MNKKEIAEIKKTLKPSAGCVQHIRCFHITMDKQCVETPVTAVARMDEEDLFNYLSLFKSTLTGALGKKLQNLSDPKEDIQNRLYSTLKGEMKDDALVKEICDSIRDNYVSAEDYFIMLMFGKYDIPVKNGNDEDEGESNDVYNYIIGCICPMKTPKGGLSYDRVNNTLTESFPPQLVSAPAFGFLFPAFHDRAADVNSILSYCKSNSDEYANMYENVLGCKSPISSEYQKASFAELADKAFGGGCSFNEAAGLQASLCDIIAETEELGIPADGLTINKDKLTAVLEENYAPDIDGFSERYDELLGDQLMTIQNIVDPKKTVIKLDEISIISSNDLMRLISMREIDGEKCLVIRTNGMTIDVNGMSTSD